MGKTTTKPKRARPFNGPDRYRPYWAHDELVAATEFASAMYGLEIDGERLGDDEVMELRDLVERASTMSDSDLDPRQAAITETYVIGLNELREKFPNKADETEALIKTVRQLGRVPNASDQQDLRAGIDPLELRVRRRTRSAFNRGAVATNLKTMSPEEVDRMQRLIEKAAGKVGYFTELANRAKIAALTAKARKADPKRTAPPLPGGVVLPVEVMNDVCPPNAHPDNPDVPDLRKRYLEWADVAVLWAILALLQSRRLPIGSRTRLEEDGEALVFTGPPLGGYAEYDVVGVGPTYMKSLERLRLAKWLEVENLGDNTFRVRLGARARKFGLGDGEPKPSAAAATLDAS